jgi:hypothetical protein
MGVKIYCGGKLEAAVKTKDFKLNGQTVVVGKETKLRMDKNHFTGMNTEGAALMTPHGFIELDEWDSYKKENKTQIVQYFKDVTREVSDLTNVVVEDGEE